MRMIGKILLRGLAVLLPTALTVFIIGWIANGAETLLSRPILEKTFYFPGMGLLAAFVLVFLVGLLTYFTLFRWVVRLLEAELNRIPLVKTLFGSIKDLMAFFPGDEKKPSMKKVVLADVGGAKIVGMVTREEFEELPEPMQREGEVLVYLPMSYQLGGFTVWMPRSSVQPVDMTVAEAMRFAMTGGMSTTAVSEKRQTDK